ILLGRRFLLQGAGRFLSCSPRRSCGRLVSLLFLRARACVLEPMPSSLCRKAQVWNLLPDSRLGPRYRGRISALHAGLIWSSKRGLVHYPTSKSLPEISDNFKQTFSEAMPQV